MGASPNSALARAWGYALLLATTACTGGDPDGTRGRPATPMDDGGGGACDGACVTTCGNDACDADESCTACAADCGECAPVCDDDGTCELGETCAGCGGDCGSCEEGAPCARLNAAIEGETVVISGEMGDDRDKEDKGCEIDATAVNVTVVGSWNGDVRCERCDGWVFEHLTVTNGSLRMIDGSGWTIRESTFDGGGRGVMEVLGTGSGGGQPTDWLLDQVVARNAGCRPADDPYPTHVRALYVIGQNGVPMNGTIRGSAFEGEGCGYTVKIGGTGNFGSWSGAADAADSILFEDNVVRNIDTGDARQRVALLLATNSDDVTVRGNTLTAGDLAIQASGPWSGTGLRVEENTIDAPEFLRDRVWNHPEWGANAPLGGEAFVNYLEVGPCPALGTCTDNAPP